MAPNNTLFFPDFVFGRCMITAISWAGCFGQAYMLRRLEYLCCLLSAAWVELRLFLMAERHLYLQLC